jgi:UDP:flavonoid glycosyltransferase YjiC (YdhE family)
MTKVKILFAALPAYGHLYPLMPLALACAEAGHDVTVACAAPFLDRLPLPTVRSLPDLEGADAFAEASRRDPEAHGVDLVVRMFADVASEAVADTLLPLLADERPDLVVYEAMDIGAGVAADVLEIPAVGYAISLDTSGYALMHPPAIGYRSALWSDRGRTPPRDRTFLGRAILSPSPPSLLATTADLGVPQIPVRPVAYAERLGGVPSWLAGRRERPRAYLTLGTVSFGAVEVLRRALDDLQTLDVDVLVTVGPEGDPAALGAVGERVHVERFVDQGAVLDLVDVVVHHGGTGTVLSAAAAGLPQLILPQGADQFANVDVMTRQGSVRGLLNHAQRPGAIAEAVSALLADGPERAAARQLAAEIAAMPAPAEVVEQVLAHA